MMAQYGKITATYIDMNKKSLQEPLDTSQPIDVFFNLINDVLRYASKANMPFTQAKALKMAYQNLSLSKNYSGACKYWHRRPSAANIWENFKTFFGLEYYH